MSAAFEANHCTQTSRYWTENSYDVRPTRSLSKGEMEALYQFVSTHNIDSLDLNGRGICDEHMIRIADAIGRCPSIISINLCNNSIGDRGAEALAKALQGKQVAWCNLADNRIGVDGAFHLMSAGPKAFQSSPRSLPSLDLSHNAFRKDDHVQLAERLRSFSGKIPSVNLRKNGVGAKGVQAFCEKLPDDFSLKTQERKVTWEEEMKRNPCLFLFIMCVPPLWCLFLCSPRTERSYELIHAKSGYSPLDVRFRTPLSIGSQRYDPSAYIDSPYDGSVEVDVVPIAAEEESIWAEAEGGFAAKVSPFSGVSIRYKKPPTFVGMTWRAFFQIMAAAVFLFGVMFLGIYMDNQTKLQKFLV